MPTTSLHGRPSRLLLIGAAIAALTACSSGGPDVHDRGPLVRPLTVELSWVHAREQMAVVTTPEAGARIDNGPRPLRIGLAVDGLIRIELVVELRGGSAPASH